MFHARRLRTRRPPSVETIERKPSSFNSNAQPSPDGISPGRISIGRGKPPLGRQAPPHEARAKHAARDPHLGERDAPLRREAGLHPDDPCCRLDRDDRPSTTRKRQPRHLNGAQLSALLAELGDDFRPFGAMLAYAGLRVSEALAIRWRDLDLDAGRLSVAAQLDRSGQTVPLKTTPSAAVVELLPALRPSSAPTGIAKRREEPISSALTRSRSPPGRASLTISGARYGRSRTPRSPRTSGTSQRTISATRSWRTRSTPG